jgi:hypothetical protein
MGQQDQMEIKENGNFNSNKMTTLHLIRLLPIKIHNQYKYNVSMAHDASDYCHHEFIQLPKEQSN